LMQVVYDIPNKTWETSEDQALRRDFAILLDIMMQGASIEGVYNGMVHSGKYRELERKPPSPDGGFRVASAAVLEIFARELAELEKDLADPRQFDARDATPATSFEPLRADEYEASGGIAPGGNPAELDSKSPAAAERRRKSSKEYAALFVGGTVFTLKRVLSDEWVRLVASHSGDRNALAARYARMTERMNRDGVFLGSERRGRKDSKFHYEWAMQARPEQVLWEGLNRIHRVLNAKDQERQ
ncbi:MAG: hypothetical protein AAB425_01465, partial [Bdellovibrionota bacterium]